MKIGILGPGRMANKMAATMNRMKDVELYAAASRDLQRAKDFASEHNIEKAYGSYEEMLSDDKVELVYIATPHNFHYEQMKMCIEHKKPVLCEKSFTFNADEAKEIKRLSEKTGVYVCEALWPRFMPSRQIINDILKSEPAGKISSVSANLSYNIINKERIMKPELAGGALLDIGVYGLNFFVMHLGKDIIKTDTTVVMTPSGVDGREIITFVYSNGTVATTTHDIYSRSDRNGVFNCENGYIRVTNINNPGAVDIFDTEDKLLKHYDMPEQISGLEYQVTESIKCIKEARNESYSMPLSESVYLMEIMDGIRNSFIK